MRHLCALAVAVAVFLLAPAVASACAPAVTVTTAEASVKVGQPQSYRAAVCFSGTPGRYDVQVLLVTATDDGRTLTEQPVTSAASRSLADASAQVRHTGTFSATALGDYLVRVRYFAAGRSTPDMIGEAVWTVRGSASRAVEDVPAGESIPEPQAQTTATRLSVRHHSRRTTARAGQAVGWTLTVSNRGTAAARDVELCDRMPAGAGYLSASAPAQIRGRRVCFALGAIAPRQRRVVTLQVLTGPAGRHVNDVSVRAVNAPSVRDHATLRVTGRSRA